MEFLYDTGASFTVICHRKWSRLSRESQPDLEETPIRLTSVGGQDIPMWGRCPVTLSVGGQSVPGMVQVCEVEEDAILGLDALRALRAQWNWEEHRLVVACANPSKCALKKWG